MKFIASLYVEYLDPPPQPIPPGLQIPFVPKNVKRLSVVVSTSDDPKYSFLAYGVDPSTINDAERSFVFERHVDIGDLGAFLKIIADGRLDDAANAPPRPHAAMIGDGPVGYSVDISNAVPRPPGPSAQVVFAYGDTAAASNTVGNS